MSLTPDPALRGSAVDDDHFAERRARKEAAQRQHDELLGDPLFQTDAERTSIRDLMADAIESYPAVELRAFDLVDRILRALNTHGWWVEWGATVERLDSANEDLRTQHRELSERVQAMEGARKLVDEQAEDEGLWFLAQTAPEAYLQQELRRLHAVIEQTTGCSVMRDARSLDSQGTKGGEA